MTGRITLEKGQTIEDAQKEEGNKGTHQIGSIWEFYSQDGKNLGKFKYEGGIRWSDANDDFKSKQTSSGDNRYEGTGETLKQDTEVPKSTNYLSISELNSYLKSERDSGRHRDGDKISVNLDGEKKTYIMKKGEWEGLDMSKVDVQPVKIDKAPEVNPMKDLLIVAEDGPGLYGKRELNYYEPQVRIRNHYLKNVSSTKVKYFGLETTVQTDKTISNLVNSEIYLDCYSSTWDIVALFNRTDVIQTQIPGSAMLYENVLRLLRKYNYVVVGAVKEKLAIEGGKSYSLPAHSWMDNYYWLERQEGSKDGDKEGYTAFNAKLTSSTKKESGTVIYEVLFDWILKEELDLYEKYNKLFPTMEIGAALGFYGDYFLEERMMYSPWGSSEVGKKLPAFMYSYDVSVELAWLLSTINGRYFVFNYLSGWVEQWIAITQKSTQSFASTLETVTGLGTTMRNLDISLIKSFQGKAFGNVIERSVLMSFRPGRQMNFITPSQSLSKRELLWTVVSMLFMFFMLAPSTFYIQSFYLASNLFSYCATGHWTIDKKDIDDWHRISDKPDSLTNVEIFLKISAKGSTQKVNVFRTKWYPFSDVLSHDDRKTSGWGDLYNFLADSVSPLVSTLGQAFLLNLQYTFAEYFTRMTIRTEELHSHILGWWDGGNEFEIVDPTLGIAMFTKAAVDTTKRGPTMQEMHRENTKIVLMLKKLRLEVSFVQWMFTFWNANNLGGRKVTSRFLHEITEYPQIVDAIEKAYPNESTFDWSDSKVEVGRDVFDLGLKLIKKCCVNGIWLIRNGLPTRTIPKKELTAANATEEIKEDMIMQTAEYGKLTLWERKKIYYQILEKDIGIYIPLVYFPKIEEVQSDEVKIIEDWSWMDKGLPQPPLFVAINQSVNINKAVVVYIGTTPTGGPFVDIKKADFLELFNWKGNTHVSIAKYGIDIKSVHVPISA